jgi:SAM-dependent methyltransferase
MKIGPRTGAGSRSAAGSKGGPVYRSLLCGPAGRSDCDQVTDDHVLGFVTGALPVAPARVLEVGAGDGEMAEALRGRGYDVVAIDPAGGPGVRQVHLHELDEPERSFDAALAVLSLHHVEPLAESLDRLAALLPPGARVVVDEFDIACFDERAAAWWADQRELACGEPQKDPMAMVRTMRGHLHTAAAIRSGLQRAGFALGPVERGPYLYRWHLPPGLRGAEEQLIAVDLLPRTGVRFVAVRS